MPDLTHLMKRLPKKNDQSDKFRWSLRRKTDEEIIRLIFWDAIFLPKPLKGSANFYIRRFDKLI